MKKWISLEAELDRFHQRDTIYLFSVKMSFLAVILSSILTMIMLPPLKLAGILPMSFTDAIRYGVALSWFIGGLVSGALALLSGQAIHDLSVSRAEFERLSRTDALSGLLNRRAFAEMLDTVEEDASLAILDLDRFKAINDRHGHASGDAVIVAISKMLTDRFDSDNPVGRLGGEEFAVLVCGGDVDERLSRIEAVRAEVCDTIVPVEGGDVRITISAGMADVWPGRRKESIYAAADKALYLAKALGRNRIVHETEQLQPDGQTPTPDDGASRHGCPI